MFAEQGMGQGPCTLALRASQSRVCVQRDPTGRVLIVLVIENRKRADKRKKEKERREERARERGAERQSARDAPVCHMTHGRFNGTHGGVSNVHAVSVLNVHTSHSTPYTSRSAHTHNAPQHAAPQHTQPHHNTQHTNTLHAHHTL